MSKTPAVNIQPREGRLAVRSPYDPSLVDLFKEVGGRWDKEARVWLIPPEALPRLAYHPLLREAMQAFQDSPPPPVWERVGKRYLLKACYLPVPPEELLALGGYKVEGAWKGDPGVWAFPDGAFPALRAHPYLGQSLPDPLPEPKLPHEVVRTLLREQVEDFWRVYEAYRTRRGFLLANGTGTGKTYIYAAFARVMNDLGHEVVVVLPNEDLVRQNAAVLDLMGARAKATTYVRFEPGMAQGRVVIFDEAHLAKNVRGKGASDRARKVYWGSKRSLFALYVTATPFDAPWEAEYLEAIEIHRLTGDDTFEAFIERFGVRYVEREYLGRTALVPTFVGGAEDLLRFYNTLIQKGFMSKRLFHPPEGLVRHDAAILEIPQKDREVIREVRRRLAEAAKMAPAEHRGLVSAFRTGFSRAILERVKLRAAIPYLRGLLEEGWSVFLVLQYRSEKRLDLSTAEGIEEFLEQENTLTPYVLRALRGLSFHLPSPLGMVEEAFADLGPALAFYTGRETESRLKKAKEAFNQGKVRLLVATGAKGGTGLSLHDTVGDRPTAQVVLTLPWTAIQLDQILGRVVRVGMKSPVLISLPVAKGVRMETGLSRVIGARLQTLGYAVRGGQVPVPPEVLQAFEAGLADVNEEAFTNLLREVEDTTEGEERG